MARIEKASFDFLNKLSKNNNREWFGEHKSLYTTAHENIIDFAGALLGEMNKHEQIETASGKQSLYRIYKDVRFSKEKLPYNTHWSGGFRRATKKLRGGYYFHLQPGNSFIAGGFFGPNTEDMQRIRQDIDANYTDWQKVLSGKVFTSTFGNMKGDQLATAPRGYAKDHPAIELLRYKQFLLRRDFSDEEVLAADFAKQASDVYKKMRPFLDHMSELLTTDANGISLVD
ncbi:MAG: hypothetical protein JWQ38_2794 [Flavipsychrobacter sp.]|nr:hypothetical protein [Flavipsychrobacter sp.]